MPRGKGTAAASQQQQATAGPDAVLSWEASYERLLAYPVDDADGTRSVPQHYLTPDGFRLGTWLATQRQAHRAGALRADRFARLDAAGVVWEPHAKAWERALEVFTSYARDAAGRRIVPQSFVSADGFKLGVWQDTQRTAFKRGTLSRERVAKLDEAGIVWDPMEAAWERGFAHFVAFQVDDRGRRNVPQRFVMPDGYRLGNWHDNQRQAYKRGAMRADRISRLEEAGIVWDPLEVAWEEGFAHFSAFPRDASGFRLVPQLFRTSGGFRLGMWQDTQRKARRRGALTDSRTERLEAAGIVWDANEAAWEEGFSHFMAYPADAQGWRHVTQTFVTEEGFKLGWWQHAQRVGRKRGELNDDRIQRLDEAGFIWDSMEAVWEDNFARFEALPRTTKGLRNVPQDLILADGNRIGKWLSVQRQAYKKGLLTPERIQKLEMAGIDWDPLDTAWEEAFARFKAYTPDAEGRRLVTQRHVTIDGFRLGAWQDAQRKAFKSGSLGKKRQTRLQAAGMVWSPQDVAWEDGFKRFSELTPDTRGRRIVRQSYVTDDGYRLGAWQDAQRQAYKKRSLLPDRVSRLEGAGMVWDVRRVREERLRRTPLRDMFGGASGDTSCDRREHKGKRILQAAPLEGGLLAPEGGLLAADADAAWPPGGLLLAPEGGLLHSDAEAAWHEEWRQRLGCWWLALPGPTQAELSHCLGALSLHLGARLERLRGRQTPSAAGAEPGCEWLEGGQKSLKQELELPEFPSLDGFDFSLPPIPRLLPTRGEWGLVSRAQGNRPPLGSSSWSPLGPLGVSVGALALPLALLAAALGGRQRLTAARREPECRAPPAVAIATSYSDA